MDATHKVREICREIQASSAGGQQCLVLAHFPATLSLVEEQLRQAALPYQRFSTFDFSALGSGLSVSGGAAEGSKGSIWLGLARSFQPPSGVNNHAESAQPVRIIVAEHHPRQSLDQGIIEAAGRLSCGVELSYHISLDDPLLLYFGSTSLRPLLEKLGLDESTCISHPLVTGAIRRAQERIERTVQRDVQTESLADWFRYNLPERGK